MLWITWSLKFFYFRAYVLIEVNVLLSYKDSPLFRETGDWSSADVTDDRAPPLVPSNVERPVAIPG